METKGLVVDGFVQQGNGCFVDSLHNHDMSTQRQEMDLSLRAEILVLFQLAWRVISAIFCWCMGGTFSHMEAH
jgi:hypothetical protein